MTGEMLNIKKCKKLVPRLIRSFKHNWEMCAGHNYTVYEM